jgi:hypothetical protein
LSGGIFFESVLDYAIFTINADMTPALDGFTLATVASGGVIKEFFGEELLRVVVVVGTAITTQPKEHELSLVFKA